MALPLILCLAGSAPPVSHPPEEPLLFGAVSFYNPRLMYLKYQPLVDYLTEHTGHRWELSLSRSYQDTVEALCAGRLTAAYLGPLTYVRARAACGVVPVVRLQTGGAASFHSEIVVRADSAFRTVAELEGTRFGFGAPLSTSSHLAPRAMLLEAGLVPGRNVECRYFGHHERAARAVLLGEVEAAGVRDVVAAKFVGRGLRVLARSEAIPNFPLAMGRQVSPDLRQTVTHALVELPRSTPALAEEIAGWDVELARGFAPCTDEEFDPVRQLAATVFGPEALLVPESELECDAAVP